MFSMLCRRTVLKLDSQRLHQAISDVMAEVQTMGVDFVFASALMSVIALRHTGRAVAKVLFNSKQT